jgi:methionyl-tRNA formyltransferase
MKADVFTSSVDFLEAISETICINRVYCEEKKVTTEIFDFCKWNQIVIELITEIPVPAKLKSKDLEVGLGIVFGFGLIFTKEQISVYASGIWNVHPGELPKYRGRHPITLAFLNNERTLAVVIHKINELIDQGELLAIDYVIREFRDDESAIISKVMSKIKTGLLSKALKNFQESNFEVIKYAPYTRNFLSGIAISNSVKHTQLFLYNAILAQSIHGGVEIEGERYVRAHFYHSEIEKKVGGIRIECSDGYLLVYKNLD